MAFLEAEPRRRRTRTALAGLALTATVAGCSGSDRLFGAGSEPLGTGQNSPSMATRLHNILQSPPQPTAADRQAATLSVAEATCPPLDVRQGAATLLVPPGNADAFSLRYQASIGELARECSPGGGIMRMKLGIEGRILVGPAGGAGQIEVPLRYAVVREGPEPKTVLSKLSNVKVTIPEGAPNVVFTHVDSDVAFPVPPGLEIESYVVYVGFDPQPEKPQPARRPARR